MAFDGEPYIGMPPTGQSSVILTLELMNLQISSVSYLTTCLTLAPQTLINLFLTLTAHQL